MTCVLVGTTRLAAPLLAEARAACKALELQALDWVGGIPRVTPVALITGLASGERRIPDEICALLDATPAMRLVLCVQEPLVKPRVVIANRVTLVAPPIDSTQLVAALRGALDLELAAPPVPGHRRFEVLRRTHWVAWTRGEAGPPISLHEEGGATVVVGAVKHRAAAADAVIASQSDRELETELAGLIGSTGVAHLTPQASEWILYWPRPRPLWLCSRHRLPSRWNCTRTLAAMGRRLIRIPAHRDDQLVAAWSDASAPDDALAPIERTMIEGGSETITGLASITERLADLTGLVMEVR